MSKTILIVDDEPHVRRVLQLTLERAGYSVKLEYDGKAGLDHVLADPPDVLVTDINMPRMNGREMVQAVNAALPGRSFPILVMTSLTSREERAWVQAMDNIDFLEKPVSPRELLTRVTRLFQTDEAAATEALGA